MLKWYYIEMRLKMTVPFFLFVSCIAAQEAVFTVKKKKAGPIPLSMVGKSDCVVNQLYTISRGRMMYDSISIYKMTYKTALDYNKKLYYMLSKADTGTGYVVLWTRNKTTGELKQTYVKPLYFTYKK